MVAAVAGDVPVKGAPSCQRCDCLRGSGHLGNRSTMTVYLRRRPLLLCSVVHTNIPLRLPLRNVIRKFSIHRRSIVASVPLLPAKAREGAGAWLLLRRCTVAAVIPLVPAKAREGAWGWLLLRQQCCTVAAAVASHERFRTITMTTTVLRRRTRDIIAGAAAATAV